VQVVQDRNVISFTVFLSKCAGNQINGAVRVTLGEVWTGGLVVLCISEHLPYVNLSASQDGLADFALVGKYDFHNIQYWASEPYLNSLLANICCNMN